MFNRQLLKALLTPIRDLIMQSRPAYKDYLGEFTTTNTKVLLEGFLEGADQTDPQNSPIAVYGAMVDNPKPMFVEGEMYQVTINGTTQDAIAKWGDSFEGASVLTNAITLDDLDLPEGDLWLISAAITSNGSKLSYALGFGEFANKPFSVTQTKTVTEKKYDVKLLSEELLPNSVARRTDVAKAVAKANTAQSTANTAQSTANTAKSTANTAKSTAEAAQSTANTAKSTANTAKSTAEAAQSTANTAKSTANTAKSTAEAAAAKNNPTIYGWFQQNPRYASLSPGLKSHTEGDNCRAKGDCSHAEGRFTSVYSNSAHAEGYGFYASVYLTGAANATVFSIMNPNVNIYEEGSLFYILYDDTLTRVLSYDYEAGQITLEKALSTKALSNTLMYFVSAAYGHAAHVEGDATSASGYAAHAEGGYTAAIGHYSHAEGEYTVANRRQQHVEGGFNIIDEPSNSTPKEKGQYLHIAGNGTSGTQRSNAHTLDWDGNAWFSGDVYTGSTSGTNRDDGSKKLATEKYVDSQKFSGSYNDLTDTPMIPTVAPFSIDSTSSDYSTTSTAYGDQVKSALLAGRDVWYIGAETDESGKTVTKYTKVSWFNIEKTDAEAKLIVGVGARTDDNSGAVTFAISV